MRKLLSILMVVGAGSTGMAASENWFSAGASFTSPSQLGAEFGLRAKDFADLGGITLNTRVNGNVYTVNGAAAFNLNGDLLFNVYTDELYGTRVYVGPRGSVTAFNNGSAFTAGLVAGVAFTNAERTFDTFVEGSYDRLFTGGGTNVWGLKAGGTYHASSALDVYGDLGFNSYGGGALFGAGLGLRADLGNNLFVFAEGNFGKMNQMYTGSGWGTKVGLTFKF